MVGVTGEHIASMNTQGSVAITGSAGEITELDLEHVIEQAKVILCPPDRQILHALPRSYSVDGHKGIQNPLGMTGQRLDVEAHVVTASRSFVDNLVKAIDRAGLGIENNGIALASLAAAESALTPEEKQVGVALADIGGGTTDIAVFHRGTVCYSAVIPVGGWNVSHDLALGLNISDEEAERLKIEAGSALIESVAEDEIVEVNRPGSDEPIPIPRRVLSEIIQPRMEELFEMVGQKIAEAGIGAPGAGVVFTGGASLLPGAFAVAESVLKDAEIRLGLPRCAGGIADSVNQPPFATSVGLVMWAARRNAEAAHENEEGHLLSPVQRGFRRIVKGVFRGSSKR
jgi:cell division protein FtsA